MNSAPTPETLAQYRVFRERLEQYLHLVLIFQALKEGTREPGDPFRTWTIRRQSRQK